METIIKKLSMDKIIEKLNKLSLPATIIIASLILGGFFYASQVNKQRSIERQQEIKITQEQKEYVAKRKLECYDIYEREDDKWSNIEGHWYNEVRDICVINYTKTEKKHDIEEAECEELGGYYTFKPYLGWYCEITSPFIKEF